MTRYHLNTNEIVEMLKGYIDTAEFCIDIALDEGYVVADYISSARAKELVDQLAGQGKLS